MTRWTISAGAALSAGLCLMPAYAADATGAGSVASVAGASAFTPQAAPADLTANDKAQVLIDTEPRVVQARHALEAARHRADMLTAGPHEWTARASSQRRSYRAGTPNVNEWSLGIERTIRIGGKAAIDRELGETHVRLAEARLGEARHEAARQLLDLWLNWTSAARTRELWSEQVALAQASFNAAGTRRRVGDASLLEQNAARADLAEVQRQLSTAANEEAKARAKLSARFSQIELQRPASSPEPLPLSPSEAQWRERILAESDELKIVLEEMRRAELQAKRASADRLADPTIGVHAASEVGGAERVVGFTISVPFGGTYRGAQARETLAQVEVARAAVEAKQRELESEISEALTDARGSLERWQFAQQANAATQENTRLTQRAYTLGEADLATTLLARRQSLDAALGAASARADALRARYRLLVDAHLIWGLQDE